MTPEEEMEALRVAREKKFHDKTQRQYWDKIKSGEVWAKPNARELYERLKETKSQSSGRYEINEWNKNVIFNLCLYFSEDPKFEEMGDKFSLKKGIMLSGNPGTGKSHLMNFFTKNPYQSYQTVTCKLVAERYRTSWKRDDLETLEWYSQPLRAEAGHPYNQTKLGYCFVDLGTEDEKKNFGNSMNVMEHIIFQRYENKLDFNLTHFMTNLNPSELEGYYGVRVRDRLKEMCNQMVLTGPSFR